jgi:hypothetical protein
VKKEDPEAAEKADPGPSHRRRPSGGKASPPANPAFDLHRKTGNRAMSHLLGASTPHSQMARGTAESASQVHSFQVQIRWSDDSVEFYHRLVAAVSRQSGVPEAALWQPLNSPSHRLHGRLANDSALREGPMVSVSGQVWYDPSTSPVASVDDLHSEIKAAPKVESAPGSDSAAGDFPNAKPAPGETTQQRLRRQAMTSAKVLSKEVADADARGYAGINMKIEHTGEELVPSFVKQPPIGPRPSGTTPVSAETVFQQHLKPELDMILMSGKGTYQIQFARNSEGRMAFLYFGRVEPRKPGISEREELDALGIPDRRKIYARVFQETEEVLKDYGIKVAGFTAEQLVLWIAGGMLFRALGLLGSAALKSFPTLLRALQVGETFNLVRAMESLAPAEGEELSLLMQKAERGVLTATEQARLAELAGKIESALGVLQKLARPQLPGGVTAREFGTKIMRWGTGNDAARARIASLTRQELEASGVTREMAEAWRDFYRTEALRVPTNPSAQGRAELMQRAAELLGGGR